jgi:hypothetical protein
MRLIQNTRIARTGLLPTLVLLLLAGQLHATSVPPEGYEFESYLRKAGVNFQPLDSAAILSSASGLQTTQHLHPLQVLMPDQRPDDTTGVLIHKGDSLSFMVRALEGGDSYFDFVDDSAMAVFIASNFKDLLIPVRRNQGPSHISFPYANRYGSAGYELEFILPQMGISPQEDGNLRFGALPEVRDAIASCIVQWAILVSVSGEGAQLVIDNGRMRILQARDIQELPAGTAVLNGTYEPAKFVAPPEPRTHFLWFFAGLIGGGLLMGVVVFLLGKRNENNAEDKSGVERGELEHLVDQVPDDNQEIIPEEDSLERKLEDLKETFGRDQDEAMQQLGELLGVAVADSESALAWLEEIFREIEGPEQEHKSIILYNRLMHGLRDMANEMDYQKAANKMGWFCSMYADAALTAKAVKMIHDGASPAETKEKTMALLKELNDKEEISVLPPGQHTAFDHVQTVLERLSYLESQLNAPDRAHSYLSALEQQRGRLFEKLGRMQDPPNEEERAEILKHIFTTVVHLEDFMRVYLGSTHSATTQLNPRLIEDPEFARAIPESAYQVFSENIAEVPRAVRNFRDIARSAGVRELSHVFIEGYVIPPSALDPK